MTNWVYCLNSYDRIFNQLVDILLFCFVSNHKVTIKLYTAYYRARLCLWETNKLTIASDSSSPSWLLGEIVHGETITSPLAASLIVLA